MSAEPSTLSQVLGFTAFLAVAAFLAVCILIHREYHRAPVVEAEPSGLDILDGAPRPRCSYDGCDEAVQIHLAVGHSDWWLFCMEHGLPYLTLRTGGAA